MDLKKLRKEKGWSQGDLSTFSGLSVKTIHRIENGRVTPSSESAEALAAVFGLPFSDFLHPSANSLSSEQQASEVIPAKEKVTNSAMTWRGWAPYIAGIAASFVAVSGYLINDLYSQIGHLSEDYSQLVAAGPEAPSSDVNWLEDPYKDGRANLEGVIEEFVSYYGERPIPSLLGNLKDATYADISITLIEVSTLRFIARILSGSEGEPQRNSDIAIEFILDDFLSCYAEHRQPINLESQNTNFSNMFSCIDDITSSNGWVLADHQSDALKSLSGRLANLNRSFLRTVLGGTD